MQTLIPVLIAAVAIATVLNVLLKRFNIPTVIGYIFTGAIIGPVFNLHVHGNKQLEHVAEFGIVFLMFTIGLEFSVSHLKSMKKEVFLYGLLQVFVTGALLSVVANIFFGIDYKTGIIIGMGLALSSTAIVLKILNETGQIKTDFGRNSLGILLFQDIAVIPILLMITIVTSQDKSLSDLLLQTAINAVLALGILIVIGKYLLSYFFKTISSSNSKEIYMGSILFIVVGASYVAHHFGFSYSLGGFIAGMMIADTIYKFQVEADLIPFRDLLLGVFFVSVGLQIDIKVVIENIVPVISLAIIIMAIKTATTFIILSFSNTKQTALKTAITLAQVGEFSLVVFSILLAENMLDAVSVQIVMVTTVGSMVSTPFIINNAEKILSFIFRDKIIAAPIDESSIIGGHVILCGYGSFGQVVSARLDEEAINHVIVTNNTDAYVKAKGANKSVVFGDAADRVLLENLQIRKAMSTIVALDDMETVKQVSAAITLIDPELKIIAKVPTEEDKEQLKGFNHELLLDGNSYTASLLVDNICKSRILVIETSQLQYLTNYSLDEPDLAVTRAEQEQARLLDIMSKSFDGLRKDKDIMHIKAFHDSFNVLSEIITIAINDIMSNANLSTAAYERINTLMDNQHLLVTMNDSLKDLGKELMNLRKTEQTSNLSRITVEGLDTLLLTLKDIAHDYKEENIVILKKMTSSESNGLSRIRKSYLSAETELNSDTKALLLSSTNHMDRLRSLFGAVGENYKKLASLKGVNSSVSSS
jgi:CPA2 family monovalent cation:H+ antiporter-2